LPATKRSASHETIGCLSNRCVIVGRADVGIVADRLRQEKQICGSRGSGQESTQTWAGGPTSQTFVGRGAQRQENQQLLRSIGEYYLLFSTEKGRDPRDLKEFVDYLKSDPNARTAKLPQNLEEGWVVMVFGSNNSGSQVLAYEKEVFQAFQNRLVLFRDGSVKLMEEKDFQAALKAQ
jgi:hypothetical protein